MKDPSLWTPRERRLAEYFGLLGSRPADVPESEMKWWIFNSIMEDMEGLGLMHESEEGREYRERTARRREKKGEGG